MQVILREEVLSLGTIGDVGFEQPKYKVVVPGAFCEYSGRKALAAS